MRALLLFSALAILVAGAFLFQQMRFGKSQAQEIQRNRSANPDEVVIEIGGNAPVPRERTPVSVETRPVDLPQPEPRVAPPSGSTPENPRPPADGPKTLKLGKGDTLYKIAIKYYGSGSPAILKDIASASKITDAAKVPEGANITLPKSAGGVKRKDL